jgi:hypothetical protein
MKTTSWMRWAIGGLAVLTVAAGSFWAADSVSAATPEPATVAPSQAQDLQYARFGPGQMERGMGQFGAMIRTGDTLLAEALGISAEELEAAMEQAHARIRDERLAKAVADGTLTQEQADAIKELEGLWGGRGFGHGLPLGPRMGEDGEAYLAEALGITVEELQAAKDAAIEAGIAQAVADGKITQEQADRLLTGWALKGYMADELDGALAAALEKAVADGVITQGQADQILERDRGFFGRGLPRLDGWRGAFPGGMRGDFHRGMRGGFPGGMWGGPNTPDTQSYDDTYVAPASSL